MNKINKIVSDASFIILILTVSIIVNTISLVVNNNRLEVELKLYKDYYKSSESLFNEIEDYNENLFDSDKAIDYYRAKDKITSHFK